MPQHSLPPMAKPSPTKPHARPVSRGQKLTSPSNRGSQTPANRSSPEVDSVPGAAPIRRTKAIGDSRKGPSEPRARRQAHTARPSLGEKGSPAPAPAPAPAPVAVATEKGSPAPAPAPAPAPVAVAIEKTPTGATPEALAKPEGVPSAPRRRSSRIAGIRDFAWVEGSMPKPRPLSPSSLKAAATRAVRQSALDQIRAKRDSKAIANASIKAKGKAKAEKTEAWKGPGPGGSKTKAEPAAGPAAARPEKAIKSGRVEKSKGTTSRKK